MHLIEMVKSAAGAVGIIIIRAMARAIPLAVDGSGCVAGTVGRT